MSGKQVIPIFEAQTKRNASRLAHARAVDALARAIKELEPHVDFEEVHDSVVALTRAVFVLQAGGK